MATEPGREWAGTPLDADRIDPRAVAGITAGFDEGEGVITPKTREIFGSYDPNEAARYVFFISNRIQKGGTG